MNTELNWFKSSRSEPPGPGGSQGCVEAAALEGEGIAIRDSKEPGGSVLRFSETAWSAFTSLTRSDTP
ncbi:DUF397 domain-containing protein [Streptomyces sp. NPDC017556]|uniref:DUF397 domain-containing protein n=1 Tax=unclassified Streptomyces TaxID=2593676 RepID=UPI00378C5209